MCLKQLMDRFLFGILYIIVVINRSSNSEREERIFFPIIPFYYRLQTAGTPCVGLGPDYLQGTCNTVARCRNSGLMSAAPCEGNQGFCCIDAKNCGGRSSSPVVYFRNSGENSESCTFTVTKTNSSICQLRLDFINFSLSQPSRGSCSDFLQLSVGESYLPKICGENAGQHVYVEYLPNCADQTLSFKLSDPSSARWNIKITQIPCGSTLAAPRGCLQYYTSLTGVVRSFNYGSLANSVLRQLSPLNYTVCVLPQYGYCKINWTASSFRLQNQTTTATDPPITVCENNYVSILNPECTEQCPTGNRFCGANFTGATSSARIFELQVINNYQQDSQTDGDTGFSLQYRQMVCS